MLSQLLEVFLIFAEEIPQCRGFLEPKQLMLEFANLKLVVSVRAGECARACVHACDRV